jgi:arylsulfatase A-like enzyme
MQITDRLEAGNTIFEELSSRGYQTAVFSENPYLTVHNSDLRVAFDEVVTETDNQNEKVDDTDDHTTADGFWYTDQFEKWLAGQTDDWAACINLMDAHTPYETRPEYDDWRDEFAQAIHDQLPFKWRWKVYGGDIPPTVVYPLRRLYDGAVKQADAAFGRVLEVLEDDGCLDETLVVVTSDHGDGFAEPTAVDGDPLPLMHGMGSHEVVYHVPLLVKAPGQTDAKSITSLADLSNFPEVVEAALADDTKMDPGWFEANNEQVVTFQAAPNAQEAEKARKFTDNPERYLQELCIVYTDGPGNSVYKHASWGGSSYTAQVHNTTTEDIAPDATGPCSTPPFEVAERIAAGSSQQISVPLPQGEGDLDKYDNDDELENIDVEQRLKDLGYL